MMHPLHHLTWLLRRALAVAVTYVLVMQVLLTGLMGGAHAAALNGSADSFTVLCSALGRAGPEMPAQRSSDCPCGAACTATASGPLPPDVVREPGGDHGRHEARPAPPHDGTLSGPGMALAPFAPRAPPASSNA